MNESHAAASWMSTQPPIEGCAIMAEVVETPLALIRTNAARPVGRCARGTLRRRARPTTPRRWRRRRRSAPRSACRRRRRAGSRKRADSDRIRPYSRSPGRRMGAVARGRTDRADQPVRPARPRHRPASRARLAPGGRAALAQLDGDPGRRGALLDLAPGCRCSATIAASRAAADFDAARSCRSAIIDSSAGGKSLSVPRPPGPRPRPRGPQRPSAWSRRGSAATCASTASSDQSSRIASRSGRPARYPVSASSMIRKRLLSRSPRSGGPRRPSRTRPRSPPAGPARARPGAASARARGRRGPSAGRRR